MKNIELWNPNTILHIVRRVNHGRYSTIFWRVLPLTFADLSRRLVFLRRPALSMGNHQRISRHERVQSCVWQVFCCFCLSLILTSTSFHDCFHFANVFAFFPCAGLAHQNFFSSIVEYKSHEQYLKNRNAVLIVPALPKQTHNY